MTSTTAVDPSYSFRQPGAALAPPRIEAWRLLTTAAIGGVTALGAEAAAAVPARRAVFGGDDSSPDSSRATAAAVTVLTCASIPFAVTWHSALVVRQHAVRAWRGIPGDVLDRPLLAGA